jgi:hypothetical protein
MLSTLFKGKQILLISTLLFGLGACKQAEFYDKAVLLDFEKPSDGGNGSGGVDCSGSWGACSKTCGGGLQVFSIVTPESNGGLSCEAANAATQACNVQSCTTALSNRTETFTQDTLSQGDVDILWMIDNSGSMGNKQTSLSQNLGIFIDKFLDKGINFRMGITTSDGTSNYNGKMVGDPNKLTSAYLASVGKTQFMQYFQSIIKVGTNGSGNEQGLKTSSAFFDRYAASFLRSDANLAVVEISDEEDYSNSSVNYYLDKLYALKTNRGKVKIYSVVTKVLPADRNLPDSIGSRYIEASASTGGTSTDIKNNFSTSLLDIGTSIATLASSFSISAAPYNNAVKVFVNNVEMTTGWTYNATSRSVKFNISPAEGSQVVIKYQVQVAI